MARSRITTKDLYDDLAAAERLATVAGAHGVYVRNALAAGEGEGFVVGSHGDEVALVWCGPRGNLVIVAAPGFEADAQGAIVDGLRHRRLPWRIAMGPAAIVDALREQIHEPPLVFRDQVYYVANGERTAVAGAPLVRKAGIADRDRLVQATLLLNESDLRIEAARVDRRWLRDTVDERIGAGTTRVIGPSGGVLCKLDYGSDGPGGRVLEGVFTFAEHRGRGLAAKLVRNCIAETDEPVILHVGMHNRPARRAYESAGMRQEHGCRLLLLG